jgi:hypothetical protein
VRLVHTLYLLRLPLHSQGRGPERCILRYHYTVAKGTSDCCLRLRLRARSLLHDPRTRLLCRYAFLDRRISCGWSHQMLRCSFPLDIRQCGSPPRSYQLQCWRVRKWRVESYSQICELHVSGPCYRVHEGFPLNLESLADSKALWSRQLI